MVGKLSKFLAFQDAKDKNKSSHIENLTLTLSCIMLKMDIHTLEILLCSHCKISKACLIIYQNYSRKDENLPVFSDIK